MSIITLTTDFGQADGYVGTMKGVILSIAPQARIVDISHDIVPQNVRQAAYVLSTAAPYFPPGTIHVVVVDPGVGSARRPIAVGTERAYFVGPDNGVFSHILAGRDQGSVIGDQGSGGQPGTLRAEPQGKAWNLNPETQRAAEEGIRRVARQLLQTGEVSVVVGYGNGTLKDVTTPLFVTELEGVEQLVWNEHCLNNLSVYLTRELVTRLGRVGIVAKGCDTRTLVALLQEHQIERDRVTVIGVQCAGMVQNNQWAAKCAVCDVHTPPLYDHLVENEVSGIRDWGGMDPRDAEIAALEALTPEERWVYWQEQFTRCIRCYACRAVCPLCYCDTCIADRTQPQWVPPAFDAKGNLSWNIVRAFHLVGRCSGCDECARVCPAHIRLDLINRKLASLVRDAYGYRAGYDAAVAPPLTTFRPEDRAEFIR